MHHAEQFQKVVHNAPHGAQMPLFVDNFSSLDKYDFLIPWGTNASQEVQTDRWDQFYTLGRWRGRE